MYGRTYKTRGKDSIMEKDPEITVITALLGVLASYEWKKLSDCAQLRVLEVFHARRCEDQAAKCQKPAPPEQKIYRKYEDLIDTSELKKLADGITPQVLGPGKDDYGRFPRPPFEITCESIPWPPKESSHLPYPKDC